MAFSQVIKNSLDIGAAKLIWGTFNNAAVTTGTIDIRGTLGGTATKVPLTLIGGAICNCTSIADPDLLFSENGTMAFTTGSGDTGTWFILAK